MNKRKSILSWLLVAAMLFGLFVPSAFAEEPVTPVADPSTITQWQDTIDKSSKNVGRIWTDKSVSTGDVTLTSAGNVGISTPDIPVKKSDDADFMVSLSALSSASSLAYSVQQPLDVVLVLDVSGSMDQNMTSYSYSKTYSIRDDGTYFVLVGSTYRQVYQNWLDQWYYGSWFNQTVVVPMTSAGDTDPSHVQFYTRTETKQKKITALRNAVNNLVDYTASQNANLDEDQQHRIAVVKYAGKNSNAIGNDQYRDGRFTYNYSQIVSDFAAYTDANKESIKTTINSIPAAGATSADYGLNHAQRLFAGEGSLTGGRAEAKKVVIFFTDGEPNHDSGFSDSVATTAIGSARKLKADGASVYTVGIFEGADSSDPTDSSDETNRFMHAVSSNYPQATSYRLRSMGDRAVDSDFYKVAADSDELNNIFQDIIKEQMEPSSPTVTDPEDPMASGYITFTDRLGDYMEVKDFNAIVYAGEEFTNPNKTPIGNTTTYKFQGAVEGNPIYKDANINSVVITVQKGASTQEGDLVTVKIPAGLIPLRYYDINTEGTDPTMTISEALPVRVFYSVGPKSEILTSKGNIDPTKVDAAFLESNTVAADSGSKLKLYSNAYTAGQEYGQAMASFAPAPSNAFYYYTEDTPLYTNPGCSSPATAYNADATYYYKNDYYSIDGSGTTTLVNGSVAVSHMPEGYVYKDSNGNLYVPAGNVRTTRAAAFETPKGDNTTETSNYALYPRWEENGYASIHLGNNGYVLKDIADGSLAISKTVQAAAGFTKPTGNEFTFTVTLTESASSATPLTGSYTCTVKNGEGTEVSTGTIANGDTITLQDGYTATIEGLPAGAGYSVTETASTGFTPDQATKTGTIVADEEVTASFTNTYLPVSATVKLPGSKTLTGQGVTLENSPVTFTVYEYNAETQTKGYVAATGTLDELSADKMSAAIDFGELTFNEEGKYTYWVEENNASNPPTGYTYDTAHYLVTITVTDNGSGTLQTTTVMEKVTADNVTSSATEIQFQNSYTPESVDVTIPVTKKLTGRTLNQGEFTFALKPDDTVANDPVSAEGITSTHDAAGAASFTMHYTHAGTYSYTLSEETGTLGGITYDDTTYAVVVTVADNNGQLEASTTVNGVALTAESVVFNNKYTVQETFIVVQASKSLQEVVTKLPEISAATEESVDGEEPAETDATADTAAEPVTTLREVEHNYTFSYTVKDDQGKTVASGNSTGNGIFTISLTFTEAGDYHYTIGEVKSGTTENNGITYDSTTYDLAVTVTDDGAGNLKATYTITKDGDPVDTAAFTNTYTAKPTEVDLTVGLDAHKNLTGRDLRGGEFSFVVKENGTVVATGTNDADGDITFGNLFYTLADCGTHTYTVNEVIPEENLRVPGVTYDTKEYTFTVEVKDQGDGTLRATVNKTEDIVFNNTYAAADVQVPITATKVLNGKTLTAGMFTFELKDADNEVPNRPTNGVGEDASAIAFSNLVFHASDLAGQTEKTFTYTVQEVEVNDKQTGMTYDDKVYQISVRVYDDGNGQLKADAPSITVNGDPADAIVFTNTYLPNDFELTLQGSKSLTGRDLVNGEFSFVVQEMVDGQLQTVTNGHNDADGNIVFNKIRYEAKDIGEHTYQVSEVNGNKTQIDYDDAVYTVKVNVYDDNGNLKADVTYPEGGLKFQNTYTPTAVQVNLQASKQLSGRAMKADEFTFHISDADNKVLADATNTDKGVINFSPITFTAAGDYTLTVWEETGKADGVTYDTTKFTVEIHVEDQDGVLVASIDYPDEGIVFHNKYTEAPDPGDEGGTNNNNRPTPTPAPSADEPAATAVVPQTGDAMPLELIAIVAVMAAVAFVALVVFRKRRNNH
ncbi:Spy0128 family protein [Subdoligranulum variabile]|uniref:Spy0128 family protein n=1 Tax=Subdoligranulum variabile TaxID=214851 RepID=UPI0026EA33A7|nr:FctA domain-containing protein [Subdoligranulum variabile]